MHKRILQQREKTKKEEKIKSTSSTITMFHIKRYRPPNIILNGKLQMK